MAKAQKSIRKHLIEQLEQTFGNLQDQLGKTKFRRNIKKAAKALSEDLKKGPVEKPMTKKSPKKRIKPMETATS